MGRAEAGALMIRNLGLFDDASKLMVFTIEREIFKGLDTMASSWAETKGWAGQFNYTDDVLWLAPKEWLRGPVRHKQGGRKPSDQQEPFARFEFGTREGDDIGASENSDFHWLTRLCGLRLNQMGFAWVPNEEALGLTGRKADWKKLLREHSQNFLDRGFLLEERQGRLFLPVRVDQEELARAYENEKDNSIDDPLAPVINALEIIYSRTTDFGDLLNLTRTKFGEPTKTT